ncbi:phosphodiesterase [Bradyrhizobium sp. B120]|uniref:phosphodiesterase n=1 Tax=Bradyrhizobium sp. B120 TaxID=3410088 RepID=UPI003B982DEF
MKLIHMSDIHLTVPGRTIFGRDPLGNFERALDHVLADHRDAELMVISGDLSDLGDFADYQLLRERLSRFPIPTRLCIGNHDHRETFLGVFPECADADGFAQGVHDASFGRCLLLDTYEPETAAGSFCERRQAWLERQLSEHDGPFFLFMHHNPFPTHIAPVDRIGLLDDAAFRSIVAKHRSKVRHIFFGHCHMVLSGSVAGVPTTSLRGTNHASYPVFAEVLTVADLPESYGVAFIGADYVTVHMVEFGYRGEIRSEDSPSQAVIG